MDPELKEYLDHRFGEAAERVDQRFEQVDQRLERLDQGHRETRILLEDMRATLQTVAEGVLANAEGHQILRLDLDRQFEEVKAMNRLSYAEVDRRLRDHDRRLDILERR
jgi:nucleotidyltransferase/DNA polymerase involved in DNA repair